ncbi:MAG: ParB/RepB/Spo0J family partition protein [Ruminococcaceae bacterium]|nr:ParB/RepB/Spo0J family partition protein [Oscillospiraceae bacterium]
MAKKKGLGRGLEALFVENSTEDGSAVQSIPISEIQPDIDQPREDFDVESLNQLAESIREHGILQPILVRPLPAGGYKIIAGERRFRAAHMANLTSVPALVKNMGDIEAMETALIENLQREDLNPVEEAIGYSRLIEISQITQEEAAQRVGKPRSSISNSLRLLSLPDHTLNLLKQGKISSGHAKALLSKAPDQINRLADIVVKEGLSVRQTEKLKSEEIAVKAKNAKTKDPVAIEVELSLREALGVKVNVSYNDGSGTLSVYFNSKDQLFEFANKLGSNK